MKESRLFVTRFLCGHPLNDSDILKINEKSGLPTWLLPYQEDLISKDKDFLRMMLTTLSISRSFNLKAEPDTSSITDKSDQYTDTITNSELRRAAKELSFRPWVPRFSEFHSTTKSGPNGQALLSALTDLTLLPLSLRESIYTIAGEKLKSKMDNITNFEFPFKEGNVIDWFYSNWKNTKATTGLRKLSYFADKEGKTRIIAILDYWSQTALKPLHDYLNDNLKRIKSDCTFNQDAFRAHLRHGPFHSLDLHAATDRMPILLQERVIAFLIGKKRAKAWKEILVNLEFSIKLKNLTSDLKYEVGQPMGAYSSWPSMALTHHVLVKIAAFRVGISDFWDYIILGDDIVIANDEVAAEYKHLLKELNMPISYVKTHTSLNMYEFAKRWIIDGSEITAYSVSSILETWKSYPMFLNSLETQQLHGWAFCDGMEPASFLQKVMKVLGKWEQAHRTKKLLTLHILLQRIILNLDNVDNHLEIEGDIDQVWSVSALPEIPYNKYLFVRNVLRNRMIEQCAEDKTKLLESQRDYMALISKKVKLLDLEASVTNRLRELLIDNTPISGVFTSQETRYEKELVLLKDKDLSKAIEVYTSKALAGSAFNLGVFSMRNSHSRILAKARMVKDFLNYSKKYISSNINLDKDFPEPNIKNMVKLEKTVTRLKIRRAASSANLLKEKRELERKLNNWDINYRLLGNNFELGYYSRPGATALVIPDTVKDY